MKSKKGRGLCLFLTIVMLAELGVAGFRYPGFLRKKPVSGGNTGGYSVSGNGTNTGGYSGSGGNGGGNPAGVSSAEITAETSPGNPALISWVPDAAEIDRLPAEESALSFEEQTATFASGSVKIDFMGCLDGDDRIEFREVGTYGDELNGKDMVVYDFELASGTHEPGGYVKITVPRPAGDGDLDVVSYNSATGQWESLYFEDGGDSITYYKNHFSPDAVRSDRSAAFCNDPCFYLASTTNDFNDMTYSPLESPIRLNKAAVSKYITATSPALVAALKNGSNLDVDVQFYGTFMNVTDAAGHIDAASTAFQFLTGAELNLPILSDIKEIGGKLGMMKLLWQLTQNGDTAEALKENWADIAGTAISAVGSTNPYALALQLALYAYGQQDKPWVQRMGIHSYEFTAWDDYMKNHGVGVKVRGKNFTLYSGGSGWRDAVDTLVDICAQDCAEGNYDTFPAAMDELYRKFFDNFWELSNLQKQEYAEENYYRLGMSYDGAGNAFDNFGWKSWQDPDAKTLENWKSLIRSEVNQQVGGILRDAIRNMYISGSEAIIRDVENNILPELNKIIILEAHDPSLPKGTPFSESEYAKGALEYEEWAYNKEKSIRFNGISTKPKFWPANCSEYTYGDYDWSYFYPRPREDSDRIFVCRYYNLLQVGIPLTKELTMHFEGSGDPLHPPLDVPFTIAPSGELRNYNVVTLELTPPEAEIAGVYDFYESDFDPSTVNLDYVLLSGDTGEILRYAASMALRDARVTVDASGAFSGSGSGSFSKSLGTAELLEMLDESEGSGSISTTLSLDSLSFDGAIDPTTLAASVGQVSGSGSGSAHASASDSTGSLNANVSMTVSVSGVCSAAFSSGKLPGSSEDCYILKVTLDLKCPVTSTGKTTETIDGETYTASEDDTVTWNVSVSATYVKRIRN